ncbi:MAG: CcmD family protein [Bacteroidetes bacterium]|nr:CcmD family protein [Bacteroidota bacterium]MBU1371442.1 CcmD family protein [Bacteroidota bacterium]MBU1484008.1 CcmD family protein [Bacteroidota bacterium]MBU1759866.1 CcmD family protein [Bacteroidota bacterium]MBU2374617.1 CcmD family protein [Bacteroidota bacterium]
MKKVVSLFSLLILSISVFAQGNVEMADELRSSGKIYVVVAVMLVLFFAFIVYLFTIDKRLKKFEKGK